MFSRGEGKWQDQERVCLGRQRLHERLGLFNLAVLFDLEEFLHLIRKEFGVSHFLALLVLLSALLLTFLFSLLPKLDAPLLGLSLFRI